MMPDLQPQDIERVMHGNEDLMQVSHRRDSREHLFDLSSFDPPKHIIRGVPLPEYNEYSIGGFVPTGTSTPDIARPMMRAPLSGSTGSGEGTADGSRDGSTRDRDGDSDEAPTLSGRVTGLRSARQRPKRLTPDEIDEYSDEGGSPNGRNKRVQANRLSAQRSRQRKLQKEADLRQEVDELDREIQVYEAQKAHLDSVEDDLARQYQAKEQSIRLRHHNLGQEVASLGKRNSELQLICASVLNKNPHLAQKEYSCR